MANDSRSLTASGKAKKDEFYTQLSDIEVELKHYKSHFYGKTVLCNCDDPYESNFFKYFVMNFNSLGLKKLICTCYAGSPIIYTQLSLFDEGEIVGTETNRKPYKIELTEVKDMNGDGAVDLEDVELMLQSKAFRPKLLKGNGDFRSDECIELLKQADIVVTNPPFSLFREYMAQLFEYKKQFLIIGNINAVKYKEIFPHILANELWLGISIHSGDREFGVPDSYPLNSTGYRVDKNGKKYIRVKGVRWFTNLEYEKRHEDIVLYKTYNADEYPKYDNYDAIEVSKTSEIPCDYEGIMGVPITFIDKYNPDQFELLGMTDRQNTSGLRTKKYTVDDMKNYNDMNAGCVIKTGEVYKSLYTRFLIRRRKNGNRT